MSILSAPASTEEATRCLGASFSSEQGAAKIQRAAARRGSRLICLRDWACNRRYRRRWREQLQGREVGNAGGHKEYFRELIEETNRRSESGGLGRPTKEETGSETAGSREPLEEATREYVERLKEAYLGINERDLYELVYPIALRRVEDAEGV